MCERLLSLALSYSILLILFSSQLIYLSSSSSFRQRSGGTGALMLKQLIASDLQQS